MQPAAVTIQAVDFIQASMQAIFFCFHLTFSHLVEFIIVLNIVKLTGYYFLTMTTEECNHNNWKTVS